MVKVVQEFFLTGKLLKTWNVAAVTLIPKVTCPSHPGDFHPISCCHVLYKCISKLICSRLRLVLGDIINQAQGVFVSNRSILHNVLLCQDIVKHYTRKQCLPSCLPKIDLRKAYDTMDWLFIRDMLVALQFPYHFVKIIMACISHTSNALLINGSLMTAFQAKRGLRQGDPMLPLLFVIGMEYLSRVLISASKAKSFTFHPRCKLTKLSHLCFADELMLFCRVDRTLIMAMSRCLDTFAVASGLVANSSKSAIYLVGIDPLLKQKLAKSIDFPLGSLPYKYLGVPLSSKRLSGHDCDQLVDRITSRIRSWQAKHLSYAARLQLVNSVLINISSY